MIVIAVVNRELVQILPRELTRATPANPWVELEGALPVIPFALFAVAAGFGDDSIQAVTVYSNSSPLVPTERIIRPEQSGRSSNQ